MNSAGFYTFLSNVVFIISTGIFLTFILCKNRIHLVSALLKTPYLTVASHINLFNQKHGYCFASHGPRMLVFLFHCLRGTGDLFLKVSEGGLLVCGIWTVWSTGPVLVCIKEIDHSFGSVSVRMVCRLALPALLFFFKAKTGSNNNHIILLISLCNLATEL